MEIDKLKLKLIVEELEKYTGRGTELVSLYVPAGYDMSKLLEHLSYEYSTAQNIKDKTTRQNVMDALAKILNYVKGLRQVPPNGLVIFCGNVSKNPGESDIRLWAIEPPEKLNIRIYRCDSRFLLDPLKDMIKPKELYGLIVLDRGEATIGILRGGNIEILENKESWVPGKIRAGGQSSVRFQRLIEQDVHLWLKYLGEAVRKYFEKYGNELRGILVGGPGGLKNRFVNEDYLPYNLKQKIVGVFDTSYTNENGLKELIERAKDVLKESQYIKEVEKVRLFFEHLGKGTGMVVYGYDDVKKALEYGAAEIVLISEDYFKDSKEIIDLAEKTNAEVYVISKENPEGEQFSNFKIAAILRYKI